MKLTNALKALPTASLEKPRPLAARRNDDLDPTLASGTSELAAHSLPPGFGSPPSRLVFSQWARDFKDPMTAAAIDRVVHHSVILEMNGPSVRGEVAAHREEAERKGQEPEATS